MHCVLSACCAWFRTGEHFNGTFTATLVQPAVGGIPQSALDDDTAHLGEVHSRAETRFHETVRHSCDGFCQANVYTRQQDTRALALCESAAIHAWATCCQGGEAAVAGLTAQADQRRRVDFMQKGSMVELCSTSSSGARIQRSKWMAMDATQTALIIGGDSHLIGAGKVHRVRLSLDAYPCVAGAGPSRDQVEYSVPLDEIAEVRLSHRPGSSRASGIWSFELELAGSHASDRLYAISASQERLVLECVTSSDTFTEMWVVGLRLWLAEESGAQFSPVRHVCASTVRLPTSRGSL